MPKSVKQPVDPTRYSFALKKPSKPGSGQRLKGFALSKVFLPDGPRIDLKMPEVDAVNRLYLAGTLTHDEAFKQLLELKARLYRDRDAAKPRRIFHEANAKLLEDYWEAEYADRDLVNVESARNDLKRALDAAGPLSLVVADKKALQTQIDKTFDTNNQQRRVVASLNQMLKFLGRGFTLRKKRKEKPPVKFLTLEDFEQVLPHLQDEAFRIMCRAAFVTGARCGELFPMTTAQGPYIWIKSQLDLDETVRGTKNGVERRAFILKERREWLDEWLALPDKETLRTYSHADRFKRACRKAFPGHKEKHLVFHDIRHSYAVYLLQVKRAELSLVALSLGNSNHVCEAYYSGFVLTDRGIDHLESL